MPMIPAFCDNCGTAFPSGIFAENCVNLTMSGNRSGPCPECGGMGSVPDGVFNILGSVIEIINAPIRTLEQLQKYSKILQEAKDNKLSKEEVKEKIDKEIPELASISQFLPKTRSELYIVLGLIVSSIACATPFIKGDNTVSEIQVEKMINNSIERVLLEQKIKSLEKENNILKGTQYETPFRNSVCVCGSGKRYKQCCGKLI